MRINASDMLDCQVKPIQTTPSLTSTSKAKNVVAVTSLPSVTVVASSSSSSSCSSSDTPADAAIVGASASASAGHVSNSSNGNGAPTKGHSALHHGHRTAKNGAASYGKFDHSQCTYCQGLGENAPGLKQQPAFWEIQLDQDLLETLLSIYPEWFKDYDLQPAGASPAAMAEGGAGGGGGGQGFSSRSPPKAEVDETPIHRSLDKHKESLKVKLLLRRPINQLVDQGIMPPLKTPPGFHEQRQKLERAKMGDILKSKIQRRPDRQELIQQHILEDSNVDPSLQDKQRQLKKARLADDLNERLSHRPGPLELIKGNILKAHDSLAQAIKDGQIPFKRTCEGESRKHPPPPFVFEEDSSSEGALSPQQESELSQSGSMRSPPESTSTCSSAQMVTVAAAASAATTTSSSSFAAGVSSSCSAAASPSLGSAVSTLSPPSSVASPAGSAAPVPSPMTATAPSAAVQPHSVGVASSCSPPSASSSPVSRAPSALGRSSDSPGRDPIRNRKKSKSKSAPKTRTIKFHEYKGPPNAQKSCLGGLSAAQVETSYELLLQQQQLFLKWQLELQHKYPQIILPAAQKSQSMSLDNGMTNILPSASPPSQSASTQGGSCSQLSPPEVKPTRCLPKLEDMKVSDLKIELKRRNLPVSGSKPQLIERLRPALLSSSSMANGQSPTSNEPASWHGSLNLDSPPQLSPKEEIMSVTCPMHMEEPVSPPELHDHDSVESTGSDLGGVSSPYTNGLLSPYTNGLSSPYTNGLPSPYTNGLPSPYTNGVPSPYTNGMPSPYTNGMATPLHRPSSVGPMDVDAANSSSACFDSMDVSDIGRSLPQIPPAPPLPAPTLAATIPATSMASSLPIMTALLNHHHEVEYHLATDMSPTSEDMLRKKIEDLQRELQRSQMALQQHQTLLNHQLIQNNPAVSPRLQTPPPALTPGPSPVTITAVTQKVPVLNATVVVTGPTVARSPPRMVSVVKTEADHRKSNGGACAVTVSAGGGQKLQQKQILQQHLQHKIQQQQLLQLQQQQQQQQQQDQDQRGACTSTGSLNVKASLAAFLQNQSGSSGSTPPKVYYNINASVPVSSTTLYNAAVQQNEVANSKQRANSLPGGSGHVSRTNSLPNFVSLTTGHQKQPIVRTVTDPLFIFAKPPPDYNEAVKQHNKQQFNHMALFDTLNASSRGRESIKSQDVDDVLEILIKNGELPPSAAQEPPTPPTPKSSMTASLLFSAPSTSSSSSSSSSSTTLSSIDATIMQVSTGGIDNDDDRLDGDQHQLVEATSASPHASPEHRIECERETQLEHSVMMQAGQVSQSPSTDAVANSPGSVGAPPTFDLDLSLDLEGLEPMNLEGFSVVDVHHLKTESSDDYLVDDDNDPIDGGSLMSNLASMQRHDVSDLHQQQHQQLQPQQQQHPNVTDYVDFGDDECIHMDIDMTDVSDWLDSVLPGGTGSDGNTISGSAPLNANQHQQNHGQHHHQQQQHLHSHHATLNSVDCNDPLLSANQDIFNLLNLDDDFKAAPDLGSLTWDKLDYAT